MKISNKQAVALCNGLLKCGGNMIYTLTLNPAIDYVVGVNDYEEGKINKTVREKIYAGGKGINVSVVLNNLEVDSVALGFVAGPTGIMLENMLADEGIKTKFIKVSSGMTRINIKLSDMKKETEINGCGPNITSDDMNELYKYLDEVNDDDILVMSGSIPAMITQSVYSDICYFLRKRGCKAEFVIDTSSKEMLETLQYNPLLIKPNNHELGNLFDVVIDSFEKAEVYARKLKEMGAKNVMVSMGKMGAILIDENDGCHKVKAPQGAVINSVGAGDTTVAAFIASVRKNNTLDYDAIAKYCVAAGSATAFLEGLAGKSEIERIFAGM